MPLESFTHTTGLKRRDLLKILPMFLMWVLHSEEIKSLDFPAPKKIIWWFSKNAPERNFSFFVYEDKIICKIQWADIPNWSSSPTEREPDFICILNVKDNKIVTNPKMIWRWFAECYTDSSSAKPNKILWLNVKYFKPLKEHSSNEQQLIQIEINKIEKCLPDFFKK